jgi:hypothetical protein
MERIVRSLSCLFLALAVVLSGPGGSGSAHGATMVVLCGGETPGTVWLDANGNPVDPESPCYKCPSCLMFDAPSADRVVLRLTLEALPVPVRLVPAVPLQPVLAAHLRPDPRGPPPELSITTALAGSRLDARSHARTAPIRLDLRQARPWGPGRRISGETLRDA